MAAFPSRDHPAGTNCIDCHMPKQDTNLIVFDAQGHTLKPQVRNHWIKVYSQTSSAAHSSANDNPGSYARD
jgi:hypothetical protein